MHFIIARSIEMERRNSIAELTTEKISKEWGIGLHEAAHKVTSSR